MNTSAGPDIQPLMPSHGFRAGLTNTVKRAWVVPKPEREKAPQLSLRRQFARG
jgi:hypothetical protein